MQIHSVFSQFRKLLLRLQINKKTEKASHKTCFFLLEQELTDAKKEIERLAEVGTAEEQVAYARNA